MTKTFCDICEEETPEGRVKSIGIELNFANYPKRTQVCEECYEVAVEGLKKLKLNIKEND